MWQEYENIPNSQFPVHLKMLFEWSIRFSLVTNKNISPFPVQDVSPRQAKSPGVIQCKIPKSGMDRKGLKQFHFSLTEGYRIFHYYKRFSIHIWWYLYLDETKETIKWSPFQMTQTSVPNVGFNLPSKD